MNTNTIILLLVTAMFFCVSFECDTFHIAQTVFVVFLAGGVQGIELHAGTDNPSDHGAAASHNEAHHCLFQHQPSYS